MSLYGALFVGVGALKAQGTKIGIISDNIANVNTTGYKATKAAFETLVVNTSANVAYSPGGVMVNNVQLVDRQGILTATDAPTDIAMSGSGFFTVSGQADGGGQPLYTRAGSFRQDALGNFLNPNGFYLLGWPLDREGRLPGEPGNLNTVSSANLDSLEVVNIQTQSGVASATSRVEVGANLKAGENVYPGSGVDVAMNPLNPINHGLSGSAIFIPGGPNNLTVGDTLVVETGNGMTYTYNYGGFTQTADIATAGPSAVGTGNMFDATSPVSPFFSATNINNFTTAARDFTITTGAGQMYTFTYAPSSPNITTGEFNSLNNLAAAINSSQGLTARVENGQLFIAPENANDSLTFANVDAVGATGIDWVSELGLTNTTTGANRFHSMESLAASINDSAGISAVVTSTLSDARLHINVDDPLDTIAFQAGGTGNFLVEFGLDSHPNFDGTAAITPLDPAYDAGGVTGGNMASGDITAHFSRNARIYDALGAGHDLRISYLKIAENRWAVEIHALPETDVNTPLVDGQIARGEITFNGDGSLRSVSTSLSEPISIAWTNGALASEVNFDWGTSGFPSGTPGATQIGLTNGLSQFDSDYKSAFIKQNGAPVGELLGVTINPEGYVVASYSNGETQRLYKLPIADFTNPNGLRAHTGNVYSQTQESGEVNLREAGKSGMGTVVAGVLESSNVELAEELTDMIVAQRAYQAGAKVISTTDELLEELNRL